MGTLGGRPEPPAMLRARLIRIAFGLAAFVLTASAAALASHFAIDAAGDVLLRHDSYDRIAHHSRFAAVLCAAVFGAAGAITLAAAAYRDVRERSGAIRALVSAYAHRPLTHVACVVVPAGVAVLLTMESFDAWLSSGHLPTFASALGGSIALGLGIASAVGVAFAAALQWLLDLIHEAHEAIAAALERLLTLRMPRIARAGAAHQTFAFAEYCTRCSVLARRAGKRAPPLAA